MFLSQLHKFDEQIRCLAKDRENKVVLIVSFELKVSGSEVLTIDLNHFLCVSILVMGSELSSQNAIMTVVEVILGFRLPTHDLPQALTLLKPRLLSLNVLLDDLEQRSGVVEVEGK